MMICIMDRQPMYSRRIIHLRHITLAILTYTELSTLYDESPQGRGCV